MWRFEEFEVDVQSGELFCRGRKVKLQNRPFQVLMLLLENRGRLVTRDELRRRIWSHDTFVDFDSGLNKAIYALRRALRDAGARPRFVETLPRRGYRFIVESRPAKEVKADDPADGFESVVVLPLENLSGTPSEDYFADGITGELIAALAAIPSIRVISRTSAMSFKGSRTPLPVIADALNAQAVVEGSVARFGSTVRIMVQLIRAAEDKLLWSASYERELEDILRLQADITSAIADQIRRLVVPRKQPVLQRIAPAAYEACLKGVFFRDQMTPGSLEKSVDWFKTAIERDPEYARAHGELSQAYFFSGLFGLAPPEEMFEMARMHAAKAVALDETLAIAHNALASVHIFHDWDWPRAEVEAGRAVELSPGDPVGYVHLADYLSIRGRHEEAIRHFRAALALDPISRVYLAHFGLVLYRARRYDEAIAQCGKALEIDARYPNAHWFLALSLEQKGALPEAIAALEQAVGISGTPHFRALLGRVWALSGRREEAEAILFDLRELAQTRYISPFDFGLLHAGLRNFDQAFGYFEEALRQRVFRVIELTFPMFDGLRDDPRWQAIVSRLGLESGVAAAR